MSEKPYIRNPKDPGGKQWLSGQDEEDYEQELLIKQWLESEGIDQPVELKHISDKGTARNTFNSRHVSLDRKVFDDSSATLADFIAGSDGRDLEDGSDNGSAESDRSGEERLDDEIEFFCDAIGVGEGTKQWVKKSVKSTTTLRSLQSLMSDDEPWDISMISLE